MADAQGPIIGIDLGTTNSLVAFADVRGPRVLTDEHGEAILPSVVRYEPDGSKTIGTSAAENASAFPLTTVSSVKRLMGRGLADASSDLAMLTYKVVEGPGNTARVAVPVPSIDSPTVVSPQEVSAAILTELKARAETALGEPVTRAVITVPAYFDDAQRQATRDAGRLAGLSVERIVSEPTAAALAYGLGLPRDAARNAGVRHVAVYDLGGGTFDVSILRVTPPPPDAPDDATSFFQVLATAGDTRLGGDDIDRLLFDLFCREIAETTGLTARQFDPAARRALAGFARAVKHRLSEAETAQIRIDVNEGEAYDRTVTRDEFETLVAPLVERTIASCDRALRDARRDLSGAEIDAVVLVGGSTRVPLVRARVAEHFGTEPYTALDPDQVVALGAAIQASILAGEQTGALLLDVVPLSLGVETRGGAVAKLIVRNSAVPTSASEMFSTSVDGQTSIKLNVLQGEREMAEDCRSLGEFHLTGLPPMPAGIPQLEVTFSIDANGVLDVAAVERRSGKRAGVQIVPNHGLTAEEVDRIEAESFEHAAEDMTRHRVADLVTNSRLDLKWIGERLERFRDKLAPGYAAELDAKSASLLAMVEAGDADWKTVDPDAMYALKNELDQLSIRLQETAITESLKGE